VLLAERLEVAVVLGAFLVGVMVGMIDRHPQATHPHYRLKIDGIGYGVFVPVFFVVSGIRFDLDALLDRPSALAKVPLFLLALIVARGIPAAVYQPLIGRRRTVGAGLLQATSLPFIVLATQIGVSTGKMGSATAAAFIAAGLVSVLLFPALALVVLGRNEPATFDLPAPASVQ
jgi:Kef-type K+ transport system membrane component KefB